MTRGTFRSEREEALAGDPLAGFQAYADQQLAARDAALDALERHRGRLIATAKAVALELAHFRGSVTSTQVLADMKRRGVPDVEGCDLRYLGCVFRRGTGWERIGWEPTGSHGRPVARWKRKT